MAKDQTAREQKHFCLHHCKNADALGIRSPSCLLRNDCVLGPVLGSQNVLWCPGQTGNYWSGQTICLTSLLFFCSCRKSKRTRNTKQSLGIIVCDPGHEIPSRCSYLPAFGGQVLPGREWLLEPDCLRLHPGLPAALCLGCLICKVVILRIMYAKW